MSCIYKYKGKNYTKDEFYSLVRTTMVQPRTVQKSIDSKEDKNLRIERTYPKYITIGNTGLESEKLQEISKVEEKTIVPFIKDENYSTTINKLFGKPASDYSKETNSEFSYEMGAFAKSNSIFFEKFIKTYLKDKFADGKTIQDYAKDLLEKNVVLKDRNQQEIQFKVQPKENRINEKLRLDVISKFHSTKEQALTAYNQIKDLLKGSYVHQVGDKWKVYAPVQKPRSNQFPQQSIPKNKEELPIEQFKKIVDKLYNKFGQKINYKIVEPEEILKYIEEQTGQSREDLQLNLDNVPAVYKDNTILYPKNYLTSEVAFHEFSHPFVDIIVKQNPDSFNNLKNELETTDSGKLIIERVKKGYPHLLDKDKELIIERIKKEYPHLVGEDGELIIEKIKKEYPHLIDEDGELIGLTEGFWKEAIVTALGELASNNLHESKDKGLISYLKDLLKQISQYLRDLFSTPTKVIKPFEIDPNIGLEELASMLNIDNQIDLNDFSDESNESNESNIQLKKKTLEEQKIEQKKKDRENINKSPYLKQYVYFKRRLAYLEKQQKSTKEDTPSFNILQEEINKIGEGIKKVTKDQDYNTYKKLADDTLDYVKQKIEDLVDTKDRKGRPITDDEIIDISDILDTFKNFKGTESLVKEYTEKLFPLIQDRATKVIQNYSTEKNKITKEDINNQNEDIGKFTKGVGSLSDSKNYIGRTIGSIIKEAQNRKSTRSKQLKSRIEKQIDNLNNWAKKNGVSLEKTYDLFIQPKENTTMLAQQYLSNGQLNPNFKIIVDNPELSEFYQFYQDTISELQKNQSIKFGKNFIPNLKKTEGIWNKIKELINVQTTSDTDFTSKESLYADVLPTKYTKRLNNEEKSRDLGAILMSYGKHIYNQEEMSDILPTIRLLQENLKYKLTPEGILTERSFKKSSDPKTEIFGSETNLNKMIEDVINMQVFGEMKDKELYFELGNTYDENGNITGRKYVHGSNIIDLALRYNSLLRIGFSPITAASNIIFGDVSNFIEGIGGQHFNLIQLSQASNIFIKQTLDKESVLNKVLIEELNILQDLEDYNQVTDVSLKSIKKLSTDKIIEYAYSMQKSGEKYLQSRPAIAVMIKDGYLSPKGELTDKYKDATDKEKAQLVDKIQRVNQMIHGRYTQQEAATLQQSVLYRLISQFKKWLPTAIENRIGERKYDNRLQTETEGRYVTIGRLLVNFNDTYDRVKSGNLSKLEIANLKKTLTELTLFTATYLALGALKGDDEESKKLRKNWAVKTGLTLLNRVSGDISYFFDPSQISNTSKNLVPLVRTMDDLRLAISYLPSAFGEEGVYKKGSRKGQNKALTKFASIIPGPNQFYQLKRLANKQELEEFTK